MKRFTLFLAFLAAPILEGDVHAQVRHLNACRPTLTYDGKPASRDGSFSETVAADSQVTASPYHSESRTMTAADGKLQIRLDCKTYKHFPVGEYSVRLTNLSKTEPTGIISDFRSLRVSVDKPESADAVALNVLRGSTCAATDFVPESFPIAAGNERVLTTTCGRSSNDHIPFLELVLDDKHGYLFAIGWTGSWKARFANTGKAVDVEIGMERTNFRLEPGESIRQPSIAVFVRADQTRREFKTLVHRFMLENKVPRDAKGQVIPPILAVASGGGNKTPRMMADVLQYCVDNKMPFDTYWVDAGWYGAPHQDELYSNCGPNWSKYVGDWRVNTTTHPTGDLLPIANAVHQAGLKFLLWFEPERMTDSAPILKTHPEYRRGQLVDYGNPAALKWIQDTVYGMIAKHRIDVFRQDFNMNPGSVWREMDAAERVGIAEAKHIAGMYKFLDDMRARFPDILQENCASGGRRIDIEMIARAHTYCRSDYYIGRKPGDTAFILGQNATLNLIPYLPFQGCEFNCVPVGDDYAAFSIISSGTVITPSDFDGGIIRRKITDKETAWFKKVFDVAVRMRPFYMGDFHQLTDETGAGDDVWCAWQCDRPDLQAGFAIFFRRGAAPEESRAFSLGGIDPSATYALDVYGGSKENVTGAELKNRTVKLAPRSFQLIFYQKRGFPHRQNASAKDTAFKIVGYLSGGNFRKLDQIDLHKLTHLNLAFANPNREGKLVFGGHVDVKPVVARGHEAGLKVYVSLAGGGRPDKTVWKEVLQPANRSGFIGSIVAFVEENKLDGVDVDIEWNLLPTLGELYAPFVIELREALHARGKGITAALGATGVHEAVSQESLEAYDFINVMAYDKTGVWRPEDAGPHSPYSYAEDAIRYWTEKRRIPPERIVLGVPFYGYDFAAPARYVSFREIVEADPSRAYEDVVDSKYYNGIPTIVRKTELAKKKVGGVMIWEISYDTPSELSLLRAVHQTTTAGDCPVKTFFRDEDGDGIGDPKRPFQACEAPKGYVDKKHDGPSGTAR